MNRFFCIAIAALFLLGCSTEKKEENSKSKSSADEFAQKREKEKQREKELDAARLDDTKRELVFKTEHVTFLIEQVWGQAWNEAFQAGDKSRLSAFFYDEFAGTTIEDETTRSRSVSVVREETRRAAEKSKEVDREGMADYLASISNRFEKVNGLSFHVLEISQPVPGQPIWVCQAAIDMVGESSPAKPFQYESQHEIIFEIENESEIAARPAISEWNIQTEIFREADQYLTEEVTSAVLLDKVQMPDNWELDTTQMEQFWFQFSVEDYDRDGKLDLAAASNHLYPRLYYNGNGNRFVEVADSRNVVPAAGKARIGPSFGCAWIDFDNDGYPDLINGPLLYKNIDGKSFKDITNQSGLIFYPKCMGIIVADYDCDGLVDIYALYDSPIVETNTDGPKEWIDDNSLGADNQLWKNLGGGRFENVTKKANAGGGKRHTHAASWFFYDDDHYPDLFIANDFGKNVLLRNKGDGTFEDFSATANTGGFSTSMGVSTGDLNNDGQSDIYVANLFSKAGRRIIGQVDGKDYPDGMFEDINRVCSGNQLLTRGSEQPFEKASDASGVQNVGWAYGPDLVDIDGDGLLDIYSTSGFMSFNRDKPDGETCFWRSVITQPLDKTCRIPHFGELAVEQGEFWVENALEITEKGENLSSYQSNRIFLNAGDMKFIDASFASACNIDGDSRSAVSFDYDNDGDEDLLVGSVSGGALRLFKNNLPKQNCVKVRLKGDQSNSLGIGSRVTFTVGGNKFVRDLFPANGFMGSGPSEIVVGLGKATKIDSIEVRWPTGKVQRIEQMDSNQLITISENSAAPAASPLQN